MQTDVRKIITRIACRFLRGIFVKSDRLLAVKLCISHRTGLPNPVDAAEQFQAINIVLGNLKTALCGTDHPLCQTSCRL